MDLTPPGVWHFYDGRAAIEVRIPEFREDFAFANITARAFAANNLYLENHSFVLPTTWSLLQRAYLPDD